MDFILNQVLVWKDILIPVFIAVLSIKSQDMGIIQMTNDRWTDKDEQIKVIYTVDHSGTLLAPRKNRIMQLTAAWMELEGYYIK